MREPESVVETPALVGECPVWDEVRGELIWVDIERHEVHRFRPSECIDTVVRLPVTVSAAIPRRGNNGLLIAAAQGVALLDDTSSDLTWLAQADTGDRMNDGACDPEGRFWVGTLTADQTPGACALYRLDGPPGAYRLTRVVDGVALSNGLAWDASRALLYYADTVTERVDVFDYDAATGSVTDRRTFVDLHDVPGRPDGLCIDEEGGVWVAMARGATIRRFGPGGDLDFALEIDAPAVTSCCFGGDDLDDLYITTMCAHVNGADLARYRSTGGLLRLRHVGVRGMPRYRFDG